MKLRSLIALSGVLLASAPVAGAAEVKPNILIILADDLGYGDVGVQGGKDVLSPSLNRKGPSRGFFISRTMPCIRR